MVPLAAPRRWEPNRNKLAMAVVFAAPVAAWLLLVHPAGAGWLFASLLEYAGFILLLGALFVISGGIHLRGALPGTPLANTGVLGLGAVLASFIGTTGASMLLIRPFLRANAKRERKTHLVVFFIFVVANGGGMLTPLGDPPLFLGFLRGVPFLWTLRLFPQWALVNIALIVLFHVIDESVLDREERERPGSQLEEVQKVRTRLAIEGGLNFVWLGGVLGLIFVLGRLQHGAPGHPPAVDDLTGRGLQAAGLGLLAALSLAFTPRRVREDNHFHWSPMAEVAVVFLGIFVTMVPALRLLEHAGEAGLVAVSRPWHFFWMAGGLSSFLDNAPTYLTFGSLAVGVVNRLHPAAHLSAENLGGLLGYPEGAAFLSAISCGAVFMGANTYIGNGPNLMVKAIAERHHVRMPSFFGYMLWSGVVLLPLFVVVTLVFFRG